MKIKHIYIKNFLGIGEVGLDLETYSGITLIEGINHDSPTSISNGASKSSLIEAIYYAFFGKTKRGYTGDDVVNTFAKKDCNVNVIFEVSGKEYSIERYRKDSVNGSSVSFYETGIHPVDMTKGTAKETQKAIEDLIGLSDLTFSKIVYFGQEDVKSFAGLSDAELKAVFEESLALIELSEKEAIMKGEIARIGSEIGSLRSNLERLQLLDSGASATIESIKYSIETYEKSRETNLKSISGHIESTKNNIIELSVKAESDTAGFKSKISALKEKEGQFANILELQRKIEAEFKAKNDELTSKKLSHSANSSTIDVLRNKASKANSSIGVPCETCNRPYREEDIAPVANGYIKQATSLVSVNEKIKEEIDSIKEAVDSLTVSKKKLEDAVDKIKIVQHEAMSAERELAKAVDDTTLKMYEKQLTDLENNYAETSSAINPYYAQLAKQEEIVVEYSKTIKAESEKLGNLQNHLEDVKILQAAFSNSGIKNRVFDTITPELNRIIAEYMAIVDDIDVEISTMKILKSGAIREKFEIDVKNSHGASSYKGNSGGEKQKIDLCISLAFNALMRRMIKSPVNVLFLDEPFEALDAGSSEAAVELCKLVAKDSNVFIITHNQAIKDMVSNRIVVEKRDGMAKLTVK